jgi:hypothetical protein
MISRPRPAESSMKSSAESNDQRADPEWEIAVLPWLCTKYDFHRIEAFPKSLATEAP